MNTTRYTVFNYTDGIPAHHEDFGTRQEAEEWVARFRKNMDAIQGHYLTSSRERIPLSEVQFAIEEVEHE